MPVGQSLMRSGAEDDFFVVYAAVYGFEQLIPQRPSSIGPFIGLIPYPIANPLRFPSGLAMVKVRLVPR